MMPVKEMLALTPTVPGPPVLVIDENTIKQTHDAGPVCGCYEKYHAIQEYKPFLPGGVHPYNRRKIPDIDSYDVTWRRVRMGHCGYILEKPVATHESQLPEGLTPKPTSCYKDEEDELMFIQLPRFTQSYYQDKMRSQRREHVEGCNCPTNR